MIGPYLVVIATLIGSHATSWAGSETSGADCGPALESSASRFGRLQSVLTQIVKLISWTKPDGVEHKLAATLARKAGIEPGMHQEEAFDHGLAGPAAEVQKIQWLLGQFLQAHEFCLEGGSPRAIEAFLAWSHDAYAIPLVPMPEPRAAAIEANRIKLEIETKAQIDSGALHSMVIRGRRVRAGDHVKLVFKKTYGTNWFPGPSVSGVVSEIRLGPKNSAFHENSNRYTVNSLSIAESTIDKNRSRVGPPRASFLRRIVKWFRSKWRRD